MKAHMRIAITNSLIAGSIIFAVGCTGKKDEAASASATASTPSAVEEAKPADPWEGTASIKPVFPTKVAATEMGLDYESFQFDGNGLSVAPLPPHFGKPVEVKLVEPSLNYTLKAGRPDCSYKLKVTVGSGETKLLDPKQGESLQIAPSDFAGTGELMLQVGLEDGAEQNWSCNVFIDSAI